MFRKESAKRMVSSLLERTGFVCGSIKDTLSEKDNIHWIKSSASSIAQKACNADVVPQASPGTIEGRMFFEENSMERGSSEEETTVASAAESSPKRASRFAKIKKGDEGSVSSGIVAPPMATSGGANTLVIGLCLSRKDAVLGHPDTITRQTAFDFNELQDRDYNFVSSTDSSGWLAGGGEKGSEHIHRAPDKVHIPIIQINAENSAVVDEIISALARGEVFIPHMAILPEALSVNGSSPPDLVVRFDCEKNDDANPEDWPNWCLEFLHNQLYDMFACVGAQWTKRPFQITLARKVKWKTVKHMNKFFANAEQVVNTWREKGPQYLQPPESHSFHGATQEEIVRPHGIYLLRNGVPTNYFAPNFEPPYTTKVTRSLIRNVISKSWDSKRRDWLSEPIPKSLGPLKVIRTVFGCADTDNGQLSPVESHAMFDSAHDLESFDFVQENRKVHSKSPGRLRKETIANNAPDSMKPTESPKRIPNNGVATAAVPSDESFGMSPKSSGTGSMEETTESTTQPSVESTMASSTQYTKSTMSSSKQSSREEHVEQGRCSPMITSHRRSPMRTITPQQKEDTREEEMVLAVEQDTEQNVEQQKNNLHPKVEDSKAEKFAKTKSKRREMRDRRQDENTPASKSSPRTQKPLSPTGSASMSLAYSLEDSTYVRSSLTPTHIHNNDGGSVLTMGTENQSLLSYVTRSTMVQSKVEVTSNDDDADDISLSLLESNSSIVPTDEELLAIGWAKALDPNSGLYYYFTLDRSKTVWENPLSTSP